MAAFEDNNPFAAPTSPTPSGTNAFVPFGGVSDYPYSPVTNTTTTQSHRPNPSFDSIVRPSSSEGYPYRATNSDLSIEPPIQGQSTVGIVGAVEPPSEKDEGETCCRVDDLLRRNPEMRIVITDAGKASDGGAHFIAYTIDVGVPPFC
jgi:hypothetical protein